METGPFATPQDRIDFCNTCQRCRLADADDGRIISEIFYSKQRNAKGLRSQINRDMPGLKGIASKRAERRLEEERQRLIENAKRQRPDIREKMEEQIAALSYQGAEEITPQDLEESLRGFMKKGYLEEVEGKIIITPKGAKRLGSHVLNIITRKLLARQPGPRVSQRRDYGLRLSTTTRKYELGDEYHLIDYEGTLLNALQRSTPQRIIPLAMEDLRIYDEIHETRMCAGLLIDESSSMGGAKMDAAIVTALALAELIRKEPKDLFKLYLFSSNVREIPNHELHTTLNAGPQGGTTDIVAALRAFRKGTMTNKADKQAYLITDNEPNMENGRSVGFEQATRGLVREAMYYRQAGITLNIIMLDENPRSRKLASILAKRNRGRVFFTSPSRLGEVVVEDYLVNRLKN